MRFANQGWEALNGKLKHAMSSKTQRGGHCGTASTESLIKSAWRFSIRSIVHFLYPKTSDLMEAIAKLNSNSNDVVLMDNVDDVEEVDEDTCYQEDYVNSNNRNI